MNTELKRKAPIIAQKQNAVMKRTGNEQEKNEVKRKAPNNRKKHCNEVKHWTETEHGTERTTGRGATLDAGRRVGRGPCQGAPSALCAQDNT